MSREPVAQAVDAVADADYWAAKRASNVRMGWKVGAVVVLIFLVALWKFRPI